MFRKFRVYTHRRMLDAAILVLGSFRLPNGAYKVRVRWVRKDGFDFGVTEKVLIRRAEVGNWREINGF